VVRVVLKNVSSELVSDERRRRRSCDATGECQLFFEKMKKSRSVRACLGREASHTELRRYEINEKER